MSAKIPVFVICVDAIIYLLLCNLHDFTFNKKNVNGNKTCWKNQTFQSKVLKT